MESWNDLLSVEWEGVTDEYGPHSNAVVGAFEAMGATPWFECVGTPLADARVVAVGSWDAALAELRRRDEGSVYGPNGHLLGPSLRAIEIIESPTFKGWWQAARKDVYDTFGTSEAVDSAWPRQRQDFIAEYVYEFVSFLLAEIIGANEVGSTYFREMLAWFHAGRLPCGWAGRWPAGRMRVF